MSEPRSPKMPGVSVRYSGGGQSVTANAMGMRVIQERA